MEVTPVILEGEFIRLIPLAEGHAAELAGVGVDPGIWEWTPKAVRTPDDMRRYVAEAIAAQLAGWALPFAIQERRTGRLVGSTRFGNIDKGNRHVEIGWTWVARPWQRTAVNTEAKYLLLRHAFEALGCLRVEFKTDALNVRSRAAITRLGAKEEGTMRSHMVTETGRVRDTVYYSIIAKEWPLVKEHLQAMVSHTGDT